MTEKEAKALLKQQSDRRVMQKQLRDLRGIIKFLLDPKVSYCKHIDPEVRMHLEAADNEFYLANEAVKRNLANHE